MNSITIHFAGISDQEPKSLELSGIPRVGDYMTLDSGKVYKVQNVLWDVTSKGLNNIIVYLDEKGINKSLLRSGEVAVA